MASKIRELALFNLAIDGKLRGGKLVKLRVCDVAQGSHISSRATIMQQKTHSPVQFDITEYETHSLQRTKATLVYRKTKNLCAAQLLFGYTKLESTVRYLGIEVEDAQEISEQIETSGKESNLRPFLVLRTCV